MKPRRMYLVLLAALAFQSPRPVTAFSHDWSQGFGTGTCKGVAVDPEGNIIVIGEYFGILDFGDGPLPAPDLYGDMCIAKFDPEGGLIWSKNIGGFDSQLARFVTADSDGSIVIAGEFLSEVNIDGTVHSATGQLDVFLARLDVDGNRIWSKAFGDGINISGIAGCGLDAPGNVYFAVTGGAIDYGGGPMPVAADLHLVKLDPDGNHLWSHAYGYTGPNSLVPRTLAIQPDGHILVTGDFDGTIDFGGPVLTSVGSEDMFLVRFDTNGAHLWSRGFGDGGDHPPQIVATDAAGNAYLTADINGTVDFGGGPLTSAGLNDIFLASFDPDGSHRWSERFGDAAFQGTATIAVTPAGDVFTAGDNAGTLNLGGSPLTQGGYLAHFSTNGSHVFSGDYGAGFATVAATVDSWGNLVVTGDKTAVVDFGGGAIPQVGSIDIFVAKYTTTATSVADIPSNRTLDLRARPNPFNPAMTITYFMAHPGRVSVRVFDGAGRFVETLVDDVYCDTGPQIVEYRARGASGVYFVRVDTEGEVQTVKAVLVK